MIGVWFSCQQFCWLRLSGRIKHGFSERPKTILFASSAETTMHGEIIAENAFLLICADIADYFTILFLHEEESGNNPKLAKWHSG